MSFHGTHFKVSLKISEICHNYVCFVLYLIVQFNFENIL